MASVDERPCFSLIVFKRQIADARTWSTLSARHRHAFDEAALRGEKEDEAGQHADHAGGEQKLD